MVIKLSCLFAESILGYWVSAESNENLKSDLSIIIEWYKGISVVILCHTPKASIIFIKEKEYT